jgi:hypothetical protein
LRFSIEFAKRQQPGKALAFPGCNRADKKNKHRFPPELRTASGVSIAARASNLTDFPSISFCHD